MFTPLIACSIASGCLQFQMDRDPCLRISTHFSPPPGGDKDRERAFENNSHHSILAKTTMVSKNLGPSHSHTNYASQTTRSPVSTQVSSPAPGSRQSSSLSLDAVKLLPQSSWLFRESYSPGSQEQTWIQEKKFRLSTTSLYQMLHKESC